MILDLVQEDLFEANDMAFDKPVSFVYGKNGTGKTTISELIKKQNVTSDVRVFKGFEDVIDENERLNAVVLGEVNTEINKQISEIEKEISLIETKIVEINTHISKPENGEENYWTKYNDAKYNALAKQKEINNFYSTAAAEIKKLSKPQIASPNYDRRIFLNEMDTFFKY